MFVLQQLAIIIAFACSKDKHCLPILEQKLQELDLTLLDVLGVIKDVLMTLQAANSNKSEDGQVDQVAQGFDERDRAALESWASILASYIDANEK